MHANLRPPRTRTPPTATPPRWAIKLRWAWVLRIAASFDANPNASRHRRSPGPTHPHAKQRRTPRANLERTIIVNSTNIVGWIKIALGAAAAAAGTGLLHVDPQVTDFILAIYAIMSGGKNVTAKT